MFFVALILGYLSYTQQIPFCDFISWETCQYSTLCGIFRELPKVEMGKNFPDVRISIEYRSEKEGMFLGRY